MIKERTLKVSSFKNLLKENSLIKNSLKEKSLEEKSLISRPSTKALETENVTLCSMQPKKPGKICGLETKNYGILQKLIAMGILPGMPITLLKKSPSYFFEVDQTRYAVDKEIASHIYVRY